MMVTQEVAAGKLQETLRVAETERKEAEARISALSELAQAREVSEATEVVAWEPTTESALEHEETEGNQTVQKLEGQLARVNGDLEAATAQLNKAKLSWQRQEADKEEIIAESESAQRRANERHNAVLAELQGQLKEHEVALVQATEKEAAWLQQQQVCREPCPAQYVLSTATPIPCMMYVFYRCKSMRAY